MFFATLFAVLFEQRFHAFGRNTSLPFEKNIYAFEEIDSCFLSMYLFYSGSAFGRCPEIGSRPVTGRTASPIVGISYLIDTPESKPDRQPDAAGE